MDTMTTLEKWQKNYFDFAKRMQEPVVRFTGRMAGSVARYVPVKPRFMESVPATKEFVDNGLKFRRMVVDEQALFVRHMLKAMEPVITKFEMPVPEKPMAKMTEKVIKPMPRRTVRKVA
jgi:hypothetical protein